MARKNIHNILIYILKHVKIHTRIFIIFKKKEERKKEEQGKSLSVTCGMGFGDKNGDIAFDNRFL